MTVLRFYCPIGLAVFTDSFAANDLGRTISVLRADVFKPPEQQAARPWRAPGRYEEASAHRPRTRPTREPRTVCGYTRSPPFPALPAGGPHRIGRAHV